MDLTSSVGDWVGHQPALARLFARLQIDFCCQGDRTLKDVCRELGLDGPTFLRVLEACEFGRPVDDHGQWSLTTIGQLVDHILAEHHGFARAELPRLAKLFDQCTAQGSKRPAEFSELVGLFATFRPQVEAHMAEEERIVFPALRELEASEPQKRHDIAAPLAALRRGHAALGKTLHQMQELTHNFQAPSRPHDAPDAYRALLEGLKELMADLHVHMHEENHILFVKALACLTPSA
ncbi:MAG: DUF542 domain-containing protein [Phycisphaerae bacterium]